MKRKVIQIAPMIINSGLAGALYVLCDDGTIWIKKNVHGEDSEWLLCQNVPQDDRIE